MDNSHSELDVFNELAHEFAERYRRGERPSLSEYTKSHPELAEEIRDLFPAMVMMEKLGGGADPPSASATDRPRFDGPMPDQLGEYRILRELGRGGMGVVYEAVQESLSRHVALKVLSQSRQMGPVQLIRFQREAKAAALLHHTNIVPIFFVGEHEGIHYYAMQYIRGQSLDVVLREIVRLRRDVGRSTELPKDTSESVSVALAAGLLSNGSAAPTIHARSSTVGRSPGDRPGETQAAVLMSPREVSPALGRPSSPARPSRGEGIHYYWSVARLGIQVAEALAHAHLHGVLHRDIKPANLLLDLEGTIWVTDFGLAKSEDSEELTNPGDIVGTLRYMAPERFQGKADPRSDIYSLGLTLYEMLTLEPAFQAAHRVQLIDVILHDEPERPRKHAPELPRDLETIVLKAIAKNPSDRFANAREMALELARFCDGQPILSRRLSTAERLWRWSRRNPALACLSMLAATLTSILLAGSMVAAWKFHEQRDVVRAAQHEERAELGRSLLRQARALRYSGQAGRRFDALETLETAAQIAREDEIPPRHAAELRDEVIAALALADDQPVQSWSGLNASGIHATSSIDANRYVDVSGDGAIHVHDLRDRSEIQVLGRDRPEVRTWPFFVRGGQFLLILSGPRQTELWDLKEGKIAAGWPADVSSATARDDGRQIAAMRSDGAVHVYDLPGMTEVARCPVSFKQPVRYPSTWLSLSEDGHYLAFMQDLPRIAKVYELATGRIVCEVKCPTPRVHRSLALSRTGGLLAIIHDRAISVYDVTNGEQIAMLQGHQSEGIVAQFQPGGGLLASSGWDNTTRLWDPVRGELLITLQGYFRNWNGGGSRLEIVREQELIEYQIAKGDVRREIDCRLLGDSAGITQFGPGRLAYSPDGQLIAMAMRPDGVRIVRASDGIAVANLPIGDCDEVLFLPDGALLTSNKLGVCRWPVRRSTGNPMRIGPPEPLAWSEAWPGYMNVGLDSSQSGRVVGALFPSYSGAMVIDPEDVRRRTSFPSNDQILTLAISPDGHWLATAERTKTPSRHLVKVWDIATGKVLTEISAGSSPLAFSPDGRWLGIEGGYRLFRTGSWKPGPSIERSGGSSDISMAFHPSSRLVAVCDKKTSKVHLMEVETGRVVATLEAPDSHKTRYLVFSPDGRQLATAQSDQRVNVWDLSLIRDRLKRMHLAAGLPDVFSSGTIAADTDAVDRIEVEGTDAFSLKLLLIRQVLRETWYNVRRLLDPDLDDAQELTMRGQDWARLGQWRLAVADYRASLARRPDSSLIANSLAWELVFVPGRGSAEEALRLARKAVAMEPNSPYCRNTLGVALYRAGHFEEAATILKANVSLNSSPGYDWIFLAMCQHRLGRTDQARTSLENALRWRAGINMPPRQTGEFQAILRESESVMNGTIPDLPTNVFAH